MKKILIIRFSSIGDIVLTTPVIRCVKTQLNCELHFVTKESFKGMLEENPYVDKVHTFKKEVADVISILKNEKFDFVVDLHNNIRSHKLIRSLGVPHHSFKKFNIEKWVLVNFKYNSLPKVHIVDRYMDTVKTLGVENDNKGLNYFIPESDKIKLDFLPKEFKTRYVAFVIGGQHEGKMCSESKITEICKALRRPIVLLGGPEDAEKGKRISDHCGPLVYNAAGKFSLNQSAWILKNSELVITHDTGLMHIASAFQKRIISLWGGTVPELGMYPYLPGEGSKILEVEHFMRPSSKLGTRRGIYKIWNFMEMIPTKDIVKATL